MSNVRLLWLEIEAKICHKGTRASPFSLTFWFQSLYISFHFDPAHRKRRGGGQAGYGHLRNDDRYFPVYVSCNVSGHFSSICHKVSLVSCFILHNAIGIHYGYGKVFNIRGNEIFSSNKLSTSILLPQPNEPCDAEEAHITSLVQVNARFVSMFNIHIIAHFSFTLY